MIRRNRCIYDIIYDILVILAEKGSMKITPLCSYANLPLDRCNKLLSLMISRGLIRRYSGEKHILYEITDRGYEYIGIYRYLKTLLP